MSRAGQQSHRSTEEGGLQRIPKNGKTSKTIGEKHTLEIICEEQKHFWKKPWKNVVEKGFCPRICTKIVLRALLLGALFSHLGVLLAPPPVIKRTDPMVIHSEKYI